MSVEQAGSYESNAPVCLVLHRQLAMQPLVGSGASNATGTGMMHLEGCCNALVTEGM